LNLFWRVIFWVCVIGLAFANPLISFGLLVLYYLPSILKIEVSAVSKFGYSKEVLEEMR